MRKDVNSGLSLPVALTYTLAPGQSLTREVVWDQRLPAHPGAIQAPPGGIIFRPDSPSLSLFH